MGAVRRSRDSAAKGIIKAAKAKKGDFGENLVVQG